MSNVVAVLSIALALVQIILSLNSLSTREGLCADIDINLNILESSGSAARSNIVAYGVFTVVVSCFPYIILYVVPVLQITVRTKDMKPILRDGIVSWIVLLVSVVVGSIVSESRPAAVKACDMEAGKNGMPSMRAAWAVALYIYACLRKQASWLGQVYGSGRLLRIPRVAWGFLLWCIAIPFTRYELQYNTLPQILAGVVTGLVVGILGSLMSNPMLILTRLQVFLLYYIVSSSIENNFWSDQKILAISFELFICVGSFLTWRKNNNKIMYNKLNVDGERDFGDLNTDVPQEKDEKTVFSF